MKQLFLFAFLFLGLATNFSMQSQNYVGFNIDNYAGIHSVLVNPSNVVDSPFKTDINFFSFSSFAGSDYLSFNFKDLFKSNGEFDFEEDSNTTASNNNNFFLNMDALGPSFMMNITPKHSIAITTRARSFLNLHNMNGKLFDDLENGFEDDEDIDININNLNGTVHVWGELGLSYGTVLLDKQHHFLKAGVTLKYIQGAGSIYINADQIQGHYSADTDLLTTTGNLNYASTQGFDTDDLDLSNLSTGFGADIGATYEWRRNAVIDSTSKKLKDYKLKVGVSVTDIGSVTYKGTTETSYDLNNIVNTDEFEDKEVEDILDEYYDYTEKLTDSKIQLPTALHFLADYSIVKSLFVSVQGSFSLTDKSNSTASSIINAITIAPRYEIKWFSFYLPASFREYGNFAWGCGLRAGPLMVGSGSILSNAFSKSTKTADIYLGLKIPIYQ
ncbi:DUF5723 family protein [Mangrovimonas xylaniphaga]|uniref:DUF5723 family protein n=1 Tax=Mangrovimonas xylaniphaga TaxID=1645915 RepID=UPI0006B67859|nr:DUF5723 family protein [Mangrovimonas xylaniphaga]